MACELALLALGCSLYSLFYVLWHFACVYVCVRVSGPLELELSRELLYGSWDWTWVLWECSQCFYLLSRLPVPVFTLSLSFFLILKFLLYAYGYFAFMYACVSCACPVSRQARGGCQICWNQNYRWMSTTMLGAET